jgi:hypothetical protein
MGGELSVWQQFKKRNGSRQNLSIREVDCECGKHTDLVEKYRVQGFPTILKIEKHRTICFDGARTLDALERFTGIGNTLRCICLHKLAETNFIDFRENQSIASIFDDDIISFKPHAYVTQNDLDDITTNKCISRDMYGNVWQCVWRCVHNR